MWFRDSLMAQLEYLQREKERIQNQIKVLPKGKLVKKSAKGKNYYYLQKGTRLVSLCDEVNLCKDYLFRNNLQRQLAVIDQNIPILQRVIKSYRPLTVLTTAWDSIEAQQNSFHDENRVYMYQGINYSSKSEMLIAMMLTSYGIAFKYESKMYVNGRYIYPDFIIKRPKDGKIYVWEHFGKMHEDEYRNKNLKRIEEYHQEGFYFWDNLIASFDLGKNAIDMDYIDKIIKLYLL